MNKEKVVKLLKENTNLKQALIDIKEYAQDLRIYDNESDEFEIGTSILQIIDKALGDEK